LHAVANLEEQLSHVGVDEHPVEMRVGYEQTVVAVNRQATWPIDVEIGRPPAPDIDAVAIKDLNSIRQVSEVKLIPGIKGGDPGLVQPAGLGTVHTPDEVGRRPVFDVATRLYQ
jgi:hypothetical protein